MSEMSNLTSQLRSSMTFIFWVYVNNWAAKLLIIIVCMV